MKASSPDFLHSMPKDLKVAISTSPKLTKLWVGLTPLARNEWICWVTFFKKAETRKEHIERMFTQLQAGKPSPVLLAWVSA